MMLSKLLPASITGPLAFAGMLVSVTIWGGALIPFAIVKLLLPIPRWQRACTRGAIRVVRNWPRMNRLVYRAMYPRRWRMIEHGLIDQRGNYLLICNHQSWADILMLVDVFHRRAPFPRFFLKKELKYVPIIGSGCWAMDFPFMQRHSRAAVAANPALAKEDLETTRRACEKFKHEPVTVINFAEGTRRTDAKQRAQQSPFLHLLRPKSAGLSFTLNAMGEQFAGILDVTLGYGPTAGRSILASWLRGEQDDMTIDVCVRPVPQELMHGDYEADAAFRARFQAWVNDLWAEKDALLDRLAAGDVPARTTMAAAGDKA